MQVNLIHYNTQKTMQTLKQNHIHTWRKHALDIRNGLKHAIAETWYGHLKNES